MSPDPPPVIEINGLHVQYKTARGRRVTAVDGLDLSVRQGEVVGFVGPNGAGKSTTIKVLMGFIEPDSGAARIFGDPAGSVSSRRRIGYLPEVAVYYPFLTAREALRLYAKVAGVPRAEREPMLDALIARVGLAGRDCERLSGFSKGMLQRVGIAQAIMGAPDLLILDEVTSGLDPVARHDVRAILMDFKARGKTVFFSSHELTEVALLCDRIILLDGGRVVEESELAQLLASSARVVVKVRQETVPAELPDGVVARSAGDGVLSYVVESREAGEALRGKLEADGATVLDVQEEPPSLEDYFVRKLGHKTT